MRGYGRDGRTQRGRCLAQSKTTIRHEFTLCTAPFMQRCTMTFLDLLGTLSGGRQSVSEFSNL